MWNSIAALMMLGSLSLLPGYQADEQEHLTRFSDELGFLSLIIEQASTQQRIDGVDPFDYPKVLRNIELIRRAIGRHIHSPHTSMRVQEPLYDLMNVALSTVSGPTDSEYQRLRVFIEELNGLVADIEQSMKNFSGTAIAFNYLALLQDLADIRSAVILYLDIWESAPRSASDLG